MLEDDTWKLKTVLSYDHQTTYVSPKAKFSWQHEDVRQWLQEQRVSCLGMGIIKQGKLADVRVYGDLKQGQQAPYNTLFNVASLTKPVVSMTVLQLVDQGKWDLDEPLYHHWVDPDVLADPNHKLLTTRHVQRWARSCGSGGSSLASSYYKSLTDKSKKMKHLLFLVLMIPLHLSYGQHYGMPNENIFRSSGDAILRVQPDQVVLSLGIESRGKELVPTKEKNYLVMNEAIAYCKKEGIPEKYIQTDYISMNPHYDYRNDVVIDYYSVSQSISVVIDDLDKYEQILTELLNIGVNKVNNIEFRTTNLKENRYQVRKMAIEAAKEKAQFLTEEVGIELGEIINISENVSNPVNSFSRSNYANISQNIVQDHSGEADYGTLSIGMLSLRATVTLTYQIKEE